MQLEGGDGKGEQQRANSRVEPRWQTQGTTNVASSAAEGAGVRASGDRMRGAETGSERRAEAGERAGWQMHLQRSEQQGDETHQTAVRLKSKAGRRVCTTDGRPRQINSPREAQS